MADHNRAPFASLAQTYERVVVPAMFISEALNLLEFAALKPSEHVLDVACGTGIVARLAAPRLGPSGRVVGLDLNDGMLAVARDQPAPDGAPVAWELGNALALPFPAATFDAVLCQNGLQFMPDKRLALREMRRVLRPGCRLVVSTLLRDAANKAVEATIARFFGPEEMVRFREPFALADAGLLSRMFADVDFRSVDVTRQSMTARCPSAEDYLAFFLRGRFADVLERQSREQKVMLLRHAREQLRPYVSAEGLVFPVETLVVVART